MDNVILISFILIGLAAFGALFYLLFRLILKVEEMFEERHTRTERNKITFKRTPNIIKNVHTQFKLGR